MLKRRTLLGITGSAMFVSLSGCMETVTGVTSEFGGNSNSDIQDRKRNIVRIFDEGIQDRNEAITTRDSGIQHFNAEEYSEAVSDFETAKEGFQAANEKFSEAESIAAEIAEEGAREICSMAAEETSLQVQATESTIKAAEAAANGEGADTINSHIEEHQNQVENADELSVEGARVLAETLGLE